MSEQSTPEVSFGTVGTQTTNSTAFAKAIYLRLFFLFAVLGSLWAVATPLMAYPDEPSHTIRAAAVVRGQVTVEPGQSFGNGVHFQVPGYIANMEAQKCFAFQRAKTADCAPAIPSGDTFDAIGVTSAGTYNPLYYWLVGIPTLVMSGAPAIYGMRIVSVLLSALFYAAAFTALTRLRRPKWPIVTASIAITPMVLFLASGINPNSIEISASMAAFCALLAVLDNSSRLRQVIPAIATVGVATAVLANARQVSLAWLLCGVVTAFLIFRWRDIRPLFSNRYVLVTVGLATVGVALGLFWMVVALNAPASSGTAPDGIVNPAPNVAPYQAFVTMLDQAFDFISQYIGVVGWLDTPVPEGVMAFWSMLFVATFLLTFLARPRRLVWAMIAALLALAIVPALLQAFLIDSVGFIWQGRYSMPLVLVALVTAGMVCRTQRFPSGRRSRAIGRILLLTVVVAHVSSFLYVLRRYVVGIIDISTWQTMLSHPAWQPPLGWFLLSLLYAIVLLMAAQWFYAYLFPGNVLLRLPAKLARHLPGQPVDAK